MTNLESLVSKSQGILGFPKKLAEKIKYSRSLPKNHVVGDVFLVSYPKSGNTWLRFLIANAIKVHYQIEQEVNFFSILSIIPEVKNGKNIGQFGPFGRTDIPRIIKSHSPYNPYYDRVVLLVRDPRDVIVSYYSYLKTIQQISDDISISEFIRHQKYGIDNWQKHTQSWCFNNFRVGQIVKIFRYEDFLNDPTSNLFSVMKCLGISMNEKLLEEAIILSSKENMRNLESQYRSNPFMVRSGVVKDRIVLSEDDRKFVEEYVRDTAQMLGYKF
jgi:Sulfotransferase domain